MMSRLTLTFIVVMLFAFGGSASAQESTVKNAEVLINNGDKYANHQQVTLKIKAEGAVQMMVSNHDNFKFATWGPYSTIVQNYPLEQGDGKKNVYVKFKDKAGVESEAFTDDILLDTTPPEKPHVKIDLPPVSNTKELKVEIELSAVDAKYYMISNQPTFFSQKWQMLKDDFIEWELEKGADGPRTVYVKFRDIAGNETAVISDRVIIDREAPFGGEIVIDGGNKFATNQNKQVNLTLFCRGADSMMVSMDEKFQGAKWEPYATSMTYVLEGEDGPKKVFAKFKDIAGNQSQLYAGQIHLDITPPTNCGLSIDDGALVTSHINKIVKLTLDAEGADQMLISNTPIFKTARWVAYRRVVSDWKLDGEQDGLRIVYVRFKDAAGNVSGLITSEITLQRGF